MMTSKGVFIGTGRLLIACAEHWLSTGKAIHGIVSDCPDVRGWAGQRGFDLITPEDDLKPFLARAPFDYLFSIINHAIIADDILSLPRRRAVNYHDSPLPNYAGFNATAWAILDAQPTHAVTWHEMSAEVDAGDILVQTSFEIASDETAFSLGVKCSEQALESFHTLLVELDKEVATGATMPVTRPGPVENFHLRSDRPGLGLVDFTQTTAEIMRLMHGLDLGTDDNWMCRAKLQVGKALVIPAVAQSVSGPGSQPGTVLSLDAQSIRVASADGIVRFSDLTTLEGKPLDPSDLAISVGDVIGTRTSEIVQAVEDLDRVLTKHERFWLKRLVEATPAILTQVTPHEETPDQARLPYAGKQATPDQVIAAFATLVTRSGDQKSFDLGLHTLLSHDEQLVYSDVTPLRLEIDLESNFGTLTESVRSERAIQTKRGRFARDIYTRYSALRNLPDAVKTYGLCVCLGPAETLPPGASLMLADLENGSGGTWLFDQKAISRRAVEALSTRLDVLLRDGLAHPDKALSEIDLINADERATLMDWAQGPHKPYADTACIHDLFSAQVEKTPDRTALVFEDQALTYRQLDERANQVAHALRAAGIGPGSFVAVCMERSLELLAGLLGVMKAGGAYVPLDPVYPRERLDIMLEDSGAKVLLTQRSLATGLPRHDADLICIEDISADGPVQAPDTLAGPEDLAYVIFTSGSTGRPKGVMVSHRNVSNFFTGMDDVIGTQPGVWLAVTSVSFDISVLELFWTLTRGFEVIIQSETDRRSLSKEGPERISSKPMEFGLFYFAAAQGASAPGETYRLLLDGARFADTHGFSTVWTPERHFHAFGGIYPNPAVTTAAIATITENVHLRAGSVVLPLHNPLRVAEDWAVIDQLSKGRIGLSFASGWHANDFAFMPQNYERRREIMVENIETVFKLWRGEKVEVQNGLDETISVSVLPRPIQEQPPIWIASAGNVETFRAAGRLGANVLTNMLGQDIEDLRDKLAAYREARRESGFDGEGNVSVMLHTYVCEDTEKARELAREPFCNYLKSSFDLVKVAPFMFPAFRRPSMETGEADFDPNTFTDEDMDALLDHAFDRYFDTAGLFGSPEKALNLVEQLKDIGANEVACLIDFGIDTDIVLDSLPHLDRLRQLANSARDEDHQAPARTVAENLQHHDVTHLQCTPSMARMLVNDADSLAGLSKLQHLMLGGEALPQDLANALLGTLNGKFTNMYGPTETTIWSSTAAVESGAPITIGRPIANTVIRILDADMQLKPIGEAGELCIGGAGVVPGYLGRPDLTDERFIDDPFASGEQLYRTGDLARFDATGTLHFLGRLDHQVKVNGYRIELGEIETVLARHPSVWQSVVVARADNDEPAQLVAYIKTPDQADSGESRVDHWKGLWDGAYRQATDIADPRFNIAGWNDSFSGAPIAASDMREWLDATLDNIRALDPANVLEIGCGTGMILFGLLPHVDHYTGTDLSPHALDTIRRELGSDELAKVTLLNQPADGLQGLAEKSFDTVIINSVAQYFPGADYLTGVLKRASELVRDGGTIYLGDIRNLDWLKAFHTAVELHQAPGHLGTDELATRIDTRLKRDSELLLSEAYFRGLTDQLPRVNNVHVNLKRGHGLNEMSQFRMDVCLHVGEAALSSISLPAPLEFASLDTVKAALSQSPEVLHLHDVRNARLTGLIAASQAIDARTGDTAETLRDNLDAPDEAATNPQDLFDLAPDYAVYMVPARSGQADCFDVAFVRQTDGPARLPQFAPPHVDGKAARANQPATSSDVQGQLIGELRTHLRDHLPEYMVPSVFVPIDTFPLTPNGKIDRKALPAPVRAVATTSTEYVAPSNELEEAIADVWKSLLDLPQVGRQDNIFDLGANSLLTAQANQRLSARLGKKVSLVSMFRYPTIETLADHLGDDETAPQQQQQKRSQARADRRKDAAARRRAMREAQ